jgi:transposase-like protein
MDTHDPEFQPPHCPNADCLYHKELTPGWRFKRAGFFHRQARPHRIQRFTCLSCRRSFSSQTFCATYWLKRPDILPKLMTRTLGCMANRQVARDLHVAPSTIDGQLSRLGRHCLLFHAEQMRRAKPAGHIVIDGFVTFEHSQY